MLFLLLLLLSAFGSTGLFTQIGYNGPWKWDTSSEPKRQLQLRRTAPLHFKMRRVTLCFTGNLSTSAREEPGKEVGLHRDGAWQLLGHWWLLVQKHYEIAASLEKHKGKRHCQICSVSSSHRPCILRSWQYVCYNLPSDVCQQDTLEIVHPDPGIA